MLGLRRPMIEAVVRLRSGGSGVDARCRRTCKIPAPISGTAQGTSDRLALFTTGILAPRLLVIPKLQQLAPHLLRIPFHQTSAVELPNFTRRSTAPSALHHEVVA